MNLSGATEQQRRIITTLDAPLAVAAGAGSGKTFTLTNRIAYALVGEPGVQDPAISSVQEVLAITFTRKAAAELKSRVRYLLQEEGLSEEARAVEDAWITTIHGMCARILREHALELGIDPAFEVIDELESSQIWQSALDLCLAAFAREGGEEGIDRLLAWYPETAGFGAQNSLSSLLTQLWNKVSATPDGFESVRLPECCLDLSATLRGLFSLGLEYREHASSWGSDITKTDQKHLDLLDQAIDKTKEYLRAHDVTTVTFDVPGFDIQEYFDVLTSYPKLSAKYRAKKPDAEFFDHYRTMYAGLVEDAMLDLAALVSCDLLALTRMVDAVYQRMKGPNKLDNNDLLRKCKEALEGHPEIKEAYQRQFRLIMVDEFQDTDLLQVAIISLLSRDQGANVSTVGDAQQSIYRFRGADVEVFFDHKADQELRHQTLEAISLPDNFRSHRDVLAFVEKIFQHQEFFGEHFLHLNAQGEVDRTDDPVFFDRPRIKVNVYESRSGGGSLRDARAKSARAIAQQFAELRDAGESSSDMVLLLGSMSNAKIYIDALRQAGFETVVAGGSVFAAAREVKLTSALLLAITDHAASTALYEVLASPLFNLSDNALYALAHCRDASETISRSASLSKRFWWLVDFLASDGFESIRETLAGFDLDDQDQAEIIRVLRLMGDASNTIKGQGCYSALHELLVDSGWFDRLQEQGAEGIAIAGNLFKALEIIYDQQMLSLSPYEVATGFAEMLEVSKEAPGALSTLDTNFVRIMTIHASKGLEFPHVAVAEIKNGLPKSSALRIENVKDRVLFLLQPSLSPDTMKMYRALEEYRKSDELLEWVEDERSYTDVNGLHCFLDGRIAQGEMDDAQRLLYVALTRASKSLCLCMTIEGNKDFNYESKGIIAPLHQVLAWDKTPDKKDYLFEYGGTALALIHHEVLLEPVEDVEVDTAKAAHFNYRAVLRPQIEEVKAENLRSNVVSYSSLHAEVSSDEVAGVSKPDNSTAVEFSDIEDLSFEETFLDEDLHLQIKRASAVQLGTAFHLLAQRAIESRGSSDKVPEITEKMINTQVKRNELTPAQAERLRLAIPRWIKSDLAKRFFAQETISAEVPFMVELSDAQTEVFLEGEIDGLGFDPTSSEKHALLIDYKTGGNSDETDEQLYAKHLLQAQCYAIALMRSGFRRVEANFIRVEQQDPDDPSQPQVVTYNFDMTMLAGLEEAILEAYKTIKA